VQDLRTGKNDFTPEALVPFQNSSKILIISDDGALHIKISDASQCMKSKLNEDGTCLNKFLTDPNKKAFRAIWLKP
jgi:hypothetical protein